jgi:sugar phosphate isomerase/epimerase
MTSRAYQFSVFTKQWKTPPPELGRFVHELGFDGVELPVRPGFQVVPARVREDLPGVAKQLADEDVRIFSVAGPADEPAIATCGELGIPFIRVMVQVGDEGYLAAIENTKREYDALVPLLEKYGVALGVQNHCGQFVGSAVGLRQIIEPYDPKHVCAVWDAAHTTLDGEPPNLAIEILWSHLRMVNLKNAIYRRENGPEAEDVQWKSYWTTGRHGLLSWPDVAEELKRRGWTGIVCLTAEYSDLDSVDRLIAEDVAFAKPLFA